MTITAAAVEKTLTSKDGTTIAYERSGQGPSVILIDGAMGYRGYFGSRPLAAELARDFTVVTYDRRGRGGSGDRAPYAVDREIEDIAALIDEVGAPVCLYGFSSGAVLALRAAAALGNRVARLAVMEPPFNADDENEKREFQNFKAGIRERLDAGKRGDAVAFFLQDMVPPEVLEGMKHSPQWATMEAVAPTLAHDMEVMGDGAVPRAAAARVTAPALVLDGGDSPAFKHTAADALAAALPRAQRRTLEGQSTQVPSEIMAPILKSFFGG
jgi:pimeloyl-ACP methyl ester carboxylesterase